MDITLMPGRYILAVSGGVDSMVLLDIIRNHPEVKLTVAHFDHGIRESSVNDRKLVQQIAAKHRLPFVYAEGALGPGASEATARDARYAFLRQVQSAASARGIITAHHRDDLLETAVLNMLRGTGRKGLGPLASSFDVHRPLLHVSKTQLQAHARDNQLVWNEDATNSDQKYARNYVRHSLLTSFDDESKAKLHSLIVAQQQINHELDALLVNQLHMQDSRDVLRRKWFIQLPYSVAKEVLATWLRSHSLQEFDRKTIERLVVGAKVSAPGKSLDIIKNHQLLIEPEYLLLKKPTSGQTV
jgi:tRNA(Ile)-lysidine synthetase-like protein